MKKKIALVYFDELYSAIILTTFGIAFSIIGYWGFFLNNSVEEKNYVVGIIFICVFSALSIYGVCLFIFVVTRYIKGRFTLNLGKDRTAEIVEGFDFQSLSEINSEKKESKYSITFKIETESMEKKKISSPKIFSKIEYNYMLALKEIQIRQYKDFAVIIQNLDMSANQLATLTTEILSNQEADRRNLSETLYRKLMSELKGMFNVDDMLDLVYKHFDDLDKDLLEDLEKYITITDDENEKKTGVKSEFKRLKQQQQDEQQELFEQLKKDLYNLNTIEEMERLIDENHDALGDKLHNELDKIISLIEETKIKTK